jgi:hypothetical protein
MWEPGKLPKFDQKLAEIKHWVPGAMLHDESRSSSVKLRD